MTIAYYPPTKAGEIAAFATPDPKNISFDGKQFVVKTDTDYDPGPTLTADEIDRQTVRAHAKLNALKTMTPAQVQTWVQNNVTNLAQAQDAISTLAVAVGILARSI